MSNENPNSSSDESINLVSDNLDPLKCLYSKKVKVPSKNAPLLDNISKFVVNKENEIEIKKIIIKPKIPQCTDVDREEIKSTLVDKKVKVRNNVLTRLEKINKGPLFGLKNCLIQKTQVKVVTRNHSGIKGYCTGVIVAFDKHWNIALSNVHEVWRRPKRKLKSIYLDRSANEYKIKHRSCIPPITKLQSNKQEDICERKMNQILIRGEHVVSVCALNYVQL